MMVGWEWSLGRTDWRFIAFLVVGIMVIVALGWWDLQGRPGSSWAAEEQQRVTDETLEQHRAQVVELERAFSELSERLEVLETEVRLSIEAREEEHDAVDSALTIGDVDAVLKRGMPRRERRRGR